MIFRGTILILACTLVTDPALALECAPLNKPDNSQNYQKVPTANGFMFVAYPVSGKALPIKSIRLADGKRIKGAVPGDVPLTFAWFDKTSTIRGVKSLSVSYVTTKESGDRFVESWDRNHQPIAKASIPGTPTLTHNTFNFPAPNPAVPIVQMDVTLTDHMIPQFCVDVGDRLDMKFEQFRKQLSTRPRSK